MTPALSASALLTSLSLALTIAAPGASAQLKSSSSSSSCVCFACSTGGNHSPTGTGTVTGLDRASTATVSTRGVSASQMVFLDFVSGNDGNINYTTSMRNQIMANMEATYSRFSVDFSLTQPTGQYSTIVFNEGFSGGVAEAIDFRNLDKTDNANVNLSGFISGSTTTIVNSTSVIAAHELGHLMGFRHYDSFATIGGGVLSGIGGSYLPSYPGPSGATQSRNSIMATPALPGISVNDTATPSWLSERSAIKLTFAEQGIAISETSANNNSTGSAQALSMPNYTVPNTIESGTNAGLDDFSVDAEVVTGFLTNNDVDFYSFEGFAGDLINIEVMSQALDRLNGTADTQLTVLNSSGNEVNYFGTDAFNDDEFETLDSAIIDLTLPADDTYFLQVNAFSGNDTGNYELFIHRFNGEVEEQVFLSADFNQDGEVGLLDLDILGANFNSPGDAMTGDANGDGQVSLLDLDILGAQWGSVPASFAAALAASGITVPEPASLILVTAGGLLISRRRTR